MLHVPKAEYFPAINVQVLRLQFGHHNAYFLCFSNYGTYEVHQIILKKLLKHFR
jgi:hypothetical protein